jgi:hypothetical protein
VTVYGVHVHEYTRRVVEVVRSRFSATRAGREIEMRIAILGCTIVSLQHTLLTRS